MPAPDHHSAELLRAATTENARVEARCAEITDHLQRAQDRDQDTVAEDRARRLRMAEPGPEGEPAAAARCTRSGDTHPPDEAVRPPRKQ